MRSVNEIKRDRELAERIKEKRKEKEMIQFKSHIK
jgi:hypothetical protein